jgi:predicted phage tail protein
MSKKPVKIVLWGVLGELVVPEIEAEVSTVKEALLCLDANYPHFFQTILDLSAQGYHYQVVLSDENICLEFDGTKPEVYANFQIEGKTLTISPVIAGAGGLGKLFMGLALIGIGIATGGTGFILAGIAMGLQSIFSGNPDKPKENDPESLVVSGQTNTTSEGTRIPIIIGEYLVGDMVLSATYKTEYKAL